MTDTRYDVVTEETIGIFQDSSNEVLDDPPDFSV